MTQKTAVNIAEKQPATGRGLFTLSLLARVGEVCGPVRTLQIYQDGGLAIVRIEPMWDFDPLLPIPMCDASQEAWNKLREFFQTVVEMVERARHKIQDYKSLHRKALKIIPDVVDAFEGSLHTDDLDRFRLWLLASLTGTPTFKR